MVSLIIPSTGNDSSTHPSKMHDRSAKDMVTIMAMIFFFFICFLIRFKVGLFGGFDHKTDYGFSKRIRCVNHKLKNAILFTMMQVLFAKSKMNYEEDGRN